MHRITRTVLPYLVVLSLWESEQSLGREVCIEGGDCENGWGVSVTNRRGQYRYEAGRFHGGKLDGQGISFRPQNARRAGFKIGNFKKGELDGLGIDDRGDGRREEGKFKNGELHGQGLRIGQGSREEGYFRRGELHGEGKRIDKKGTREIGHFKNGDLHGEGQRTKNDGSKEIGIFENGKLHGYGMRTEKNGSIYYEGMWNEGRRHGEGNLMTVDGRIVCSGEWKHGREIHCDKTKWWTIIVEPIEVIIKDFIPTGIQEIVYGVIVAGIVGLAGLLVTVMKRWRKHLDGRSKQ